MPPTEDQRLEVGRAVVAARIERGWSKEEAARAAGISSITWKRVEDGLTVQDTKLRAVETALGWGFGSFDRIAKGKPPIIEPQGIPVPPQRGLPDHGDTELWLGMRNALDFANMCETRGADKELCSDYIRDTLVLMDSVSRAAELDHLGRAGVPAKVDRPNIHPLADKREQKAATPSSGRHEDGPDSLPYVASKRGKNELKSDRSPVTTGEESQINPDQEDE